MAAGLGGGSGNAATTLRGLNDLFDSPFGTAKLGELAAALGSDINFFLQDKPALATGRGENVESLEPFPALSGKAFFLFHPGFGIATPWAYQNLARYPADLNGQKGRARALVASLQSGDLKAAATGFYNSLEAPALDKYPVLKLFQEFLVPPPLRLRKTWPPAKASRKNSKPVLAGKAGRPWCRFERGIFSSFRSAQLIRRTFASAKSTISFAAGIRSASAIRR
jgi:hypothetical protein